MRSFSLQKSVMRLLPLLCLTQPSPARLSSPVDMHLDMPSSTGEEVYKHTQTYVHADTHMRTSLQMAMHSHIYAFCWRALLTCSVDRDKSKYLIQVRVHTALWMILEMTHCEINIQAFIERHTSQCCTAALTTFLLFFSFLSFYFFIFLLLSSPPSLGFNHYLSDSDWSSFPHQSTAKTDRDRQLHPSVFIQLIIHTFPSNIAALELRQQLWHIKAR